VKCSACRAQLDAYRDGDVSPNVASAVSTHLAQCGECQAFLDQLVSVERRLLQVRSIEPRADFTQLVMANIARLPAPVAVRQRMRIWWLGVYELVAWSILLTLTATGILHWQSVVAEAGVLLGTVGLAGADLYRAGAHFHLLTFAAAGVALECIAFAVLLTAGRNYLSSLRRTIFGAQPS